jgi:hypothetical protein
MWKTFWGSDFSRISPSNRKNVVPGAWRIEVSPLIPAEEDYFLHVFEIGNTGTTGKKRNELIDGINLLAPLAERPFRIVQYIGYGFSGRGSIVARSGVRFAHRLRPAARYGLRA